MMFPNILKKLLPVLPKMTFFSKKCTDTGQREFQLKQISGKEKPRGVSEQNVLSKKERQSISWEAFKATAKDFFSGKISFKSLRLKYQQTVKEQRISLLANTLIKDPMRARDYILNNTKNIVREVLSAKDTHSFQAAINLMNDQLNLCDKLGANFGENTYLYRMVQVLRNDCSESPEQFVSTLNSMPEALKGTITQSSEKSSQLSYNLQKAKGFVEDIRSGKLKLNSNTFKENESYKAILNVVKNNRKLYNEVSLNSEERMGELQTIRGEIQETAKQVGMTDAVRSKVEDDIAMLADIFQQENFGDAEYGFRGYEVLLWDGTINPEHFEQIVSETIKKQESDVTKSDQRSSM